jgi:DNA processing protein
LRYQLPNIGARRNLRLNVGHITPAFDKRPWLTPILSKDVTNSMRRLYTRGRVPAGGIAIIGSRTPPDDAIGFAYELARRLRRPVIAGLALGIDSAAHRGAIAGGNPTVAFVGYGFGRTYPPGNAELEREIVRSGGAIATVQPPGEPVTDESFVERDRLQALYAQAVVLVASELDGGAMHTMHFAGTLHKPCFAVRPPEGSKGDPRWAGNLRALVDGAQPLSFDVGETLEVLHARFDTA